MNRTYPPQRPHLPYPDCPSPSLSPSQLTYPFDVRKKFAFDFLRFKKIPYKN
jgi:hypothetical protein